MQPASNELVLIPVDYHERALRERVKEAGGKWQPEVRAWSIAYAAVVVQGLEDRKLD